MTTKTRNEEAFCILDHYEKIIEKDIRTDLESRNESGSCEKKNRVTPSWKEQKEIRNPVTNMTIVHLSKDTPSSQPISMMLGFHLANHDTGRENLLSGQSETICEW